MSSVHRTIFKKITRDVTVIIVTLFYEYYITDSVLLSVVSLTG